MAAHHIHFAIDIYKPSYHPTAPLPPMHYSPDPHSVVMHSAEQAQHYATQLPASLSVPPMRQDFFKQHYTAEARVSPAQYRHKLMVLLAFCDEIELVSQQLLQETYRDILAHRKTVPMRRRKIKPGICVHCGATEKTTSAWRKGPGGCRLCNACGLRYKAACKKARGMRVYEVLNP